MNTKVGTAEDRITGHCACGAVRFTAHGPFRPFVGCHCESCRRQSGHFIMATRCAADALEISGEENLSGWRASEQSTRRFCKTCGAHMFWVPDDGSTVSIFAGCVDHPSIIPAGWHIHASEKADYYDLNDGLAVYPLGSGLP
ncbi:GFA family protein [Tepidamorphus sp. 3E244]|uniref:GFA family protein n=1 Tax=Tepidamorphus sp. 3E244 TaxID=3385498 RepID=UPI0038FC8D4A